MRGAGWRCDLRLLLAFLVLWLAGCATMRGLGEDIQSLGRGVKKVFAPERLRRLCWPRSVVPFGMRGAASPFAYRAVSV